MNLHRAGWKPVPIALVERQAGSARNIAAVERNRRVVSCRAAHAQTVTAGRMPDDGVVI